MMVLSDATGSMNAIWAKTRDFVNIMLSRVAEIGGDNLEICWVAYRDYDFAHHGCNFCDASASNTLPLLEKSEWSADPQKIKAFVGGIRTNQGGCSWEEAVEHALATVMEEKTSSTSPEFC